ncbi:MAG TPA: hypothetical protein PKN57_02565 [Saprospiraceae bacterium]|nr:hypothetical protein [Saprospiraceae bacterium]HMV24034.1 hypothetical protein [Saprospiraceae bacterium]HMX82053.1 hypothetical protein [Saprospiraceae bacterium]HMX86449.1 hypothetical protein [Saprospiraceae bacterium]HMZ73898.1 hypothetical protein [Saprospiraceae bacterium]
MLKFKYRSDISTSLVSDFFSFMRKEHNNHLASKVVSYFTSLMALIYCIGGLYLLTSESMKEQLGINFCIAIGIGLIAYGVFRTYRAFQYWKYGE